MRPHHALTTSLLGLVLTAAGLTSTTVAEAAGARLASEPIRFEVESMVFRVEPLTLTEAPIQRETADTVEITLPADILFDFDTSTLRPTASHALREVADIIRQKAGRPVAIQGYTDAKGKDTYNQKLSEQRAEAVKTWLVAKEGLAKARFTSTGFGARNPVAPNQKPDGSDDPQGRQSNRRVTLIIKK